MAGNFLCHRLCLKSQHTCFFEEKNKRKKYKRREKETRWEGEREETNREEKGRMRKMERKTGEKIREKKGSEA